MVRTPAHGVGATASPARDQGGPCGNREMSLRGWALQVPPASCQASTPLLIRDSPVAGSCALARCAGDSTRIRSEEHTSELQSLMRISYAVFCLKKKNEKN